MHVTFAPKGILQIDGARIVHRNFAGAQTQYNRAGDRNFSLVIDDKEIADALVEEGWNVKIRDPRNEGDDPFMFMPVKVSFNARGPVVYLVSGDSKVRLDEDTIDCLDDVEIANVDLDIRPYDWEMNGRRGRSAYLQGIEVTQTVDRFARRYEDEE